MRRRYADSSDQTSPEEYPTDSNSPYSLGGEAKEEGRTQVGCQEAESRRGVGRGVGVRVLTVAARFTPLAPSLILRLARSCRVLMLDTQLVRLLKPCVVFHICPPLFPHHALCVALIAFFSSCAYCLHLQSSRSHLLFAFVRLLYASLWCSILREQRCRLLQLVVRRESFCRFPFTYKPLLAGPACAAPIYIDESS